MKLDTLLIGGTVIDGSGREGRHRQVGIVGDRIVLLDEVDEYDYVAARKIDVSGLVVAPGFVDVHTHYDAQAFFDPTLSPSPLHGVTTVFAGNCGFSIAPLGEEADADYLMRMLARVEGMPIESLQSGVPWDWSSTEEFLGRLGGELVPNAGFMVGHSALRRKVLRHEATKREATDVEIAEMAALLRAGLASGGIGFSSTWSPTHNDHLGDPVPSRMASGNELVALSSVLAEFPGTSLEFIPGLAPFSPDRVEVMAAMSKAAGRPLNWNVLVVMPTNLDIIDGQLEASDVARALGGEVFALTLPDAVRMRLTFRSGFNLELLPGWGRLFTLPLDQRRAALADPAQRKELADLAETATLPSHRHYANWAEHRLETFAPELAKENGRRVGDIARDRNVSPFDALADIVVADDLRTGIITTPRGEDDDCWQRRGELWRDPRVIVGASDAGAHLDMSDTFSYSTTLLAEGVRKRGLLSLEEAVRLLSSRPARFYGLVDRGRIATRAYADLVVFDPGSVGPGEVTTRYDLPGGAGRLYGGAHGIEHVFVNGAEVVAAGEFTEARPGTVLRSGHHTAEPRGGRVDTW